MTALPTSDTHHLPRQGASPGNGAPATGDPAALWARVEEARGSVATFRTRVADSTKHARSRWDCLEALQAYADCLDAQRRPLPYQLRDELRLLQLTCATDLAR